ncbi:MAG TPA: NAD-dependent epimerase/dehydratase family protein [Solirubrobacterales bacterium]|jgi:CDP-paratose 2-epimerase|nr:NAD-dependent epimerase/dehydratase family protein [Solirubrobacterales bacterium]
MRVLVTGGAGFVGGNLAVSLAARHSEWEIVALDNLMRRGSELNLPRLREAKVEFVHGDVREPADLRAAGSFDAMVECSAEPSVLAGLAETEYSVQTNLLGAFNCLERARAEEAFLVFLSTSRVYPVAPQLELRLEEAETRFELTESQPVAGAGAAGIAEDFPMAGARTLYGATKLSAELLIEEYASAFGLRAATNRCGVIAGPWQMGKVDQGVFAWWLLSHRFERPLSYIGYGGSGKQVRDLLHIDDLVDLVVEQLAAPERWSGVTANVGGGRECSLSLLETTALCRELTGNEVPIEADPETRPGDVPIYLSDCSRLHSLTSWRPSRGPREVLADLLNWSAAHEDSLRAALGFER